MEKPVEIVDGKAMMADAKFYMGYSRWQEPEQRYETWKEATGRVMNMHRQKYADRMTPALMGYINEAEAAYAEKLVLGAQRALQFGGEQLFKHEARMYNCSASYVDRPRFFQEAMYLLLCGCGVGFSVQSRHIDKLPPIAPRSKPDVKTFVVPDSIEGWADAFGVLLSSFFVGGGTFPEYEGTTVHFDFSEVRPKGAMISGGFKAPGPDGLRDALVKCEALLRKATRDGVTAMRPIVAYDYVMHMSNAVLSGGVRRSATICMFDKFDTEMLNAKTGAWWVENPQRGRSNNSVMLERKTLTREEWSTIMQAVKSFGEPGFIFTDDLDMLVNPCVEIGLYGYAPDGESGFQFCNLVETNGGACTNEEIFFRACRAAAILGTLQAGYTNFTYLSDATRRITEHEALLGVSVTGWMNNPDILFDEATMIKGAEIVKAVNREVAALIGINPAARTTCVKPSGNASVLLGTESGIHAAHSPMYIRHVQMNKEDEVTKLISMVNPKMVEPMAFGDGSSVTVAFPVISAPGSRYKRDLTGVQQLEYVKKAQQFWVEHGTNEELCRVKGLRHNISNTISVDDWVAVEEYIFQNRQWFAGISLLAASGDRAYNQAPFTEVRSAQEILEDYGDASLFASGLIVDGMHAFNNDLWLACAAGVGLVEQSSEESSETLLKRDWLRRLQKFADGHFEGDLMRATVCLKDCHILHKWHGINRGLQAIDFTMVLSEPVYVDADTLASQACAGGVCSTTF